LASNHATELDLRQVAIAQLDQNFLETTDLRTVLRQFDFSGIPDDSLFRACSSQPKCCRDGELADVTPEQKEYPRIMVEIIDHRVMASSLTIL
jgi:hypothetical protein